MSVSDPAPLPRLGEVFFDVRGNSRSMRLSWYADTGVAVFSIWQAGMCTGTFRLPMADLSRMIEILERGPAPRGRGRAPMSAVPPSEGRGADSDWYYGQEQDEPARPGPGNQAGYGAERGAGYGAERGAGYGAEHGAGYGAEHRADYGQSGYEAGYGRGERGTADYGAGGYGQADPGGAAERHQPDVDGPGYGVSGDYPAGYGGADDRYQRSGYDSRGQAAGDDYQAEAYSADYGRGDYGQGGGYERGYEPADHGPGGYGTAEPDYRTGEYSGYADDRGAGSDRGYLPGDYDDRPGTATDGSGYRDERFVAPYVADGGPAYPNENPPPGSGYQGDMRDAGYPADRRPVSPPDRHLDRPASADEYSYGADYRRR
jgi:hypothetical protein